MTESEWIERQSAAGAVFPDRPSVAPRALHFGDPAAEYAAARDPAAVFDLSDRTQLELRGADRAGFLHNFCTNDINALGAGQGCEAFLTNVKARILGHVFVFVSQGSILLETVGGVADDIIAHLGRYIIMDDVEVIDRSELFAQLLLTGQNAARVTGDLCGSHLESLGPLQHVDSQVGTTAVSVRCFDLSPVPGYLISCERRSLSGIWEQLISNGVRPAGSRVFDALRIESGLPLYGIDITADHLAPEAGRARQAISYAKGCYLGQEPIARIDAMGHVNRVLCGLRFESANEVMAGCPVLTTDGVDVGRVSSAGVVPGMDRVVALSMLSRAAASAGNEIAVVCGDRRIVGHVSRCE